LKNSIIFLAPLVITSTFLYSQSAGADPSNFNSRKLIHISGKVFTDTTWTFSFKPDSVFVYYYNFRAKYPESSETLRAQASDYLTKTALHFKGSGYITFRFFIDSTGKILRRVEVLQTDEFYKEYSFEDGLIWILFDFVNTLHDWKPAKVPKDYPPFYINLLTFKIHEGHIVNIIP
jgi:hypothetical protein